MKIAILGAQGLPNQYGGFETLAEFLVKFLSKEHEITVYCSGVDQKGRPEEYMGAKLKYYHVTSHGGKGILYDCMCLWDAACGDYDVLLLLACWAGPLIPFLSKKTKAKCICNFGGLDWKRDKWSTKARMVIKWCEKMLVKNSSILVSDNGKIRDYITEEYGRESTLIAYGGDQAKALPITDELREMYPFLNGRYAFEVARIQSDNNIEMLMKAFIKADTMPFVLVGNWKSTEWGRDIKAQYENEKNLILLDAIYDKSILDVLRSNCYLYVHGHSAGGTNPSLCEAMYLGLPVMAFSNGYNENTTFHEAMYFHNEDELAEMVKSVKQDELDAIRPKMKTLAEEHYRWEGVARAYEKLFFEVKK